VSPHNSKCRSWHLLLANAAVFGLIHVCQTGAATAQVLNQQVDQLLANNCRLLLGPGVNPAVLGQNLQSLCSFPDNGAGGPPLSGASSAGGGAASLQGSAASILNRLLLQRLNETEEEEGQEHARSSSMRLNPFSSLLSGFGRASSVLSPLYAATSGDGSSSAAFATSSHSRWNGLGFFASGLVESLNRDVTTFQNGYKSNILGITGGADYRFNRRLVAGLALSYSNMDGDFRNNGGNFSTNSFGGLLFASYLPTDRTFMQMTGGYTRNNYLVARAVSATILDTNNNNNVLANPSGLASSNSNGTVFTLGLMTGYDYPIGRFTIGPRAGVNYSNTKIGDYGERGSTGLELKYDDQWINSLQSVLGFQGTAAFSTGFGVLVHQVNADYIHEFANSQRFIHVQFAEDLRGTPNVSGTPTKFTFQNDVPVRNYFNLGTGLVMVLPNGWQPFVNFRAMVGNEQFNDYVGTFGLRIEI
jgi:uncharacterized protein YhjY with autotransporter beta-barrel domain